MKELIEYLIQNKIKFQEIDDEIININREIYYLVLPNEEDLLFSEDFQLMADYQACDKYVYQFGSRWYWENKEDSEKPKLNPLQYIGHTTAELHTTAFLGVHGCYEILNGSRLYEDWCKKAKFLGCKSLGIVEKNTLAGVLKFQLECQKNNIKPIIGASYTVFNEKKDYKYDLKFYVINDIGWSNLLAINKIVNIDNHGFITENSLSKLTDGLIIVGDPKSLDFDKLNEFHIANLSYYQLDTVVFENEDKDSSYLKNLKKFYNSGFEPIPIVDAYYLEKEDAYIKPILNSISGVRDSISTNQHFKDFEEYLDELGTVFDDDEMYFTFSARLNRNLQNLVSQCNFTITTGQKYLPHYIMTPEEKEQFETNEDLFWFLIDKGLKEKLPNRNIKPYIERIEKEFMVIEKGGFIDYFLILWDIIRFAKENKIERGIGRGSAGGSLIAYLLDIIRLNPLEFDLLFERFLNEGRIGEVVDIRIININDGDIELDFDKEILIFRENKKIFIKAHELRVGDQIIN